MERGKTRPKSETDRIIEAKEKKLGRSLTPEEKQSIRKKIGEQIANEAGDIIQFVMRIHSQMTTTEKKLEVPDKEGIDKSIEKIKQIAPEGPEEGESNTDFLKRILRNYFMKEISNKSQREALKEISEIKDTITTIRGRISEDLGKKTSELRDKYIPKKTLEILLKKKRI